MEGWVRYIRDQYFPVCPFCYGKVTIVYKASGKDTATCLDCGAKWHIYLKKGRDRHPYEMTWAMLIEDGIDGKGKAYLGKKYDSSIWKRWSLKAKRRIKEREIEKPSVEVKEKQIIKEKEVIVKIRCPYCHNLYDEQLDRCPHCGGKR